MSALISVKNLHVEFKTKDLFVKAVQGCSFNIAQGETLGLVGESGSGKSVTALSLMRLIPSPPGHITGGEIVLEGKNLLTFSENQMRKVRGNRISMIFQEPMTSLNPVFTIGYQIDEALILHQNLSKKEAREKTVELLDQVGIDEPLKRASSYPHELSGGQRQRAMIAMAIACRPELLIADEPTTALDVTIQKQILELLKDLQKKLNMSMLFISHDLGIIAEIAQTVAVMQKGQIVEIGKTGEIFQKAKHPYTKGLIACRPSLNVTTDRLPTVEDFLQTGTVSPESLKSNIKREFSKENLLEVKNLKKYFPLEKNFFGKPVSWIKAVDDISLSIRKGETLGLVGESGSGKTTLGRALLRLIEPSAGQVFYDKTDILSLDKNSLKNMRRRMQIIFQDPYASLNPRMTVGSSIMEPMIIHKVGKNKEERIHKTEELMEQVGLKKNMIHRYPHEFSGGQRQRICIARAISIQPEFIVCDESVSSLDVSIQAQILNLLKDLQDKFNLTYIFISHDLTVVKFISDQVAVMHKGRVVEQNSSEEIYRNPSHDYTKQLINAIPTGFSSAIA
ncbi:MAG: ABC transporter ATP-binding protein [Bdellovibrionales bacterium]|nr:ABC transporter ATP-binding protein [Bdellovibrionales bacterium]